MAKKSAMLPVINLDILKSQTPASIVRTTSASSSAISTAPVLAHLQAPIMPLVTAGDYQLPFHLDDSDPIFSRKTREENTRQKGRTSGNAVPRKKVARMTLQALAPVTSQVLSPTNKPESPPAVESFPPASPSALPVVAPISTHAPGVAPTLAAAPASSSSLSSARSKRKIGETDPRFDCNDDENRPKSRPRLERKDVGLLSPEEKRRFHPLETELFDRVEQRILDAEEAALLASVDEGIMREEEKEFMRNISGNIHKKLDDDSRPGARVWYGFDFENPDAVQPTLSEQLDWEMHEIDGQIEAEEAFCQKQQQQSGAKKRRTNEPGSEVLEEEMLDMYECEVTKTLPKYAGDRGHRLFTKAILEKKVVGPILRSHPGSQLLIKAKDVPHDIFSVAVTIWGDKKLVKKATKRIEGLIVASQLKFRKQAPSANKEQHKRPTEVVKKAAAAAAPYHFFKQRYAAVREAEYAALDANQNMISGFMWAAHRKLFGKDCNEDCPCPSRLPGLTRDVIGSYITKMEKDDPFWDNPKRLVPETTLVGFVDRFHSKFYGLLEKEFPKEKPFRLLERLLGIWKTHKSQIRFGLTCAQDCGCESAWEVLFNKGHGQEKASATKPGAKPSATTLTRMVSGDAVPRRKAQDIAGGYQGGKLTSLLPQPSLPATKPYVVIWPSNGQLGFFCITLTSHSHSWCVIVSVNSIATKKDARIQRGTIVSQGCMVKSKDWLTITTHKELCQLYENAKRRQESIRLRFSNIIPSSMPPLPTNEGSWTSNLAWKSTPQQPGWAGGASLTSPGPTSDSRFQPPVGIPRKSDIRKRPPESVNRNKPTANTVRAVQARSAPPASALDATNGLQAIPRSTHRNVSNDQSLAAAPKPSFSLTDSSLRDILDTVKPEPPKTMVPEPLETQAFHKPPGPANRPLSTDPKKSILRRERKYDRAPAQQAEQKTQKESLLRKVTKLPKRTTKVRVKFTEIDEERFYDKEANPSCVGVNAPDQQDQTVSKPKRRCVSNNIQQVQPVDNRQKMVDALFVAVKTKTSHDVLRLLREGCNPDPDPSLLGSGTSPRIKPEKQAKLIIDKLEQDLRRSSDPTAYSQELDDAMMKKIILKIFVLANYMMNQARLLKKWERYEIKIIRIENLRLRSEARRHETNNVLDCRVTLKQEAVQGLPVLPIDNVMDYSHEQCPYYANHNPALPKKYGSSGRQVLVLSLRKGWAEARVPQLPLGEISISLDKLGAAANGVGGSKGVVIEDFESTKSLESARVVIRVRKAPFDKKQLSKKRKECRDHFQKLDTTVHNFNQDGRRKRVGLPEMKYNMISLSEYDEISSSEAPRINLLHAAIYLNAPDIASRLLERGADKNAKAEGIGPARLLATNFAERAMKDADDPEKRAERENAKKMLSILDIPLPTLSSRDEDDGDDVQDVENGAGRDFEMPSTPGETSAPELTPGLTRNRAHTDTPDIFGAGNRHVAATTSTNLLKGPSLTPSWLLNRKPNKVTCNYFNGRGGCHNGARCRYAHLRAPLGNVLDKRELIERYTPNYNANLISVERANDGRLGTLFTAGYRDDSSNEFYLAERGSAVAQSPEGMYWYSSREAAVHALLAVITAWQNNLRWQPVPKSEVVPARAVSVPGRSQSDNRNWVRAQGGKSDLEQTFTSLVDANLSNLHVRLTKQNLLKADWNTKTTVSASGSTLHHASLTAKPNREAPLRQYHATEQFGGVFISGRWWHSTCRRAQTSAYLAFLQATEMVNTLVHELKKLPDNTTGPKNPPRPHRGPGPEGSPLSDAQDKPDLAQLFSDLGESNLSNIHFFLLHYPLRKSQWQNTTHEGRKPGTFVHHASFMTTFPGGVPKTYQSCQNFGGEEYSGYWWHPSAKSAQASAFLTFLQDCQKAGFLTPNLRIRHDGQEVPLWR